MKGAMLSSAGGRELVDVDAAAAGPVPFASAVSNVEVGSTVTMVPGTILILSSLASSWYFGTYWYAVLASVAKPGSSGTHPDRWYSGSTARDAPWAAASRM